MKAIMYSAYGTPDVIQFKEIEQPTPKDNEVLIKNKAFPATAADMFFRKGTPFIIRLFEGLKKPKSIPGAELSGVIEAIGKDVSKFKVGDEVYICTATESSTYVEYRCLSEDSIIALKPSNLTFAEAAGICDGATTALTFLREKANIQKGEKVLIIGASGAIGTMAVQLAKYFGGQVTGVCSGRNVELVKSLGADKVIDYTKEDFTKNGEVYDIIFDTIGANSFRQSKKSLNTKGRYLLPVINFTILLQMLWTSIFGNKKAIFAATGLELTHEKLAYLNDLFEKETIKMIIDKTYPFEKTADAHTYVEKGHKRGNVVVTFE